MLVDLLKAIEDPEEQANVRDWVRFYLCVAFVLGAGTTVVLLTLAVTYG